MVPPVDIRHIAQEIARFGEEIQRAFEDQGDDQGGDRRGNSEPDPAVLLAGLDDLLDALNDAEADTPAASVHALRAATGSEPEALLDHGLDLIAQLSAMAEDLGLSRAARGLAGLSLPLTCWLLRRGSELSHPELVVNAAAGLANGLREPDDLAQLYSLMTEVVEGMSPSRIQEPEVSSPDRPWRVLLLNRAIVATRSHRPALMVEAFDCLCEHLPDDAPTFFREGMGQMEALDYPQPVRDLMQRYYAVWCAGQRLH